MKNRNDKSNSEKQNYNKICKQNYKQIIENCTCMHIRKTARAVTQYYDATLAPAGITSTQLTLLVQICLSQSAAQKDICDALGMSPSSLTRTLKPLFEQDLIENETGINKKTKHLVLTDRGQLTLKLATPLWQQAQDDLLARVGEEDWRDLIEKLAVVSPVPTVIAD